MSLWNKEELKQGPTLDVKLINIDKSTIVNPKIKREELGLYRIDMNKYLEFGLHELI